jgi:hypothetical protein
MRTRTWRPRREPAAFDEAGADAVAKALERLRAVLIDGADAARAYEVTWTKRELMQEKARLVQVESRRLAEMQMSMTKERALALSPSWPRRCGSM